MLLEEHYAKARTATEEVPEEHRLYLRLLISDCAALVSDLRGLSLALSPDNRVLLRNSLTALLTDLVECALSGTGLTHHEAAPIVTEYLRSMVDEMGHHVALEQTHSLAGEPAPVLAEA
jgi:hypothetical protein